MAASRLHHKDIVLELIDDSAQINLHLQDDCGWTPLIAAAWEGDIEIVTALLRANADPNMKDCAGHTARDAATLQGHELMTILLEGHSRS